MGQTVLSLIPILWMFETNKKKFFLIESLKHNMCQTVLYFDQNLSETENATKIGNNQYIKDNMSQILLSPIQFLKWVNMGQTELSVLSLG